MNNTPLDQRAFVPCPVCKQYSHSIGGDQLAEAFMHFETMFSHRGDGIPTQFVFDEKTRDAAQVLMARALGDRTEREIIVEWLRENSLASTAGAASWIGAINQIADSIASGAHLKDMG